MSDLRLARAELPGDGRSQRRAGRPEASQRGAAVRAGAATPASRGTSAASEQRSALTAKSAVVRSAGTGQARTPLPVSVRGTRADQGQTPRSGSGGEPPQTDVLAVEEDFETNWGGNSSVKGGVRSPP